MPDKQLIAISTSTFLKALLILVLIGLIYLVWDILLIFFVALLLAALIVPLADWGTKKKIPRGLSVLVVYVAVLGMAAGVLALLVPPIVSQAGELIGNLGIYSERLAASFSALKNFGIQYGVWDNIVGSFSGSLPSGFNAAQKLVSGVAGFLGGVGSLILVLVITFYVVAEEDNFKKIIHYFLPQNYQPYFTKLWSRIKEKLSQWLRGQLILDLIVGAVSYLGLLILGVPYALLLGVLAGLFETIPYAGPIFSAVVAVVLTFLQTGGWLKPLLVMALFIVIQQLENNLLVPKIMQRAIGLDPIISILSLLIGYRLLGVGGAILAIPFTAVLSVVWAEVLNWKIKKES